MNLVSGDTTAESAKHSGEINTKRVVFFKFLKLFYCCSVTVVCIFSSPLYPTPAKPTSIPCFHPPPWFCPWQKGFEASFNRVYVAYVVLLFEEAFCSGARENARVQWNSTWLSRPWQWCPWKRQGLPGCSVSLFWWNRFTAREGAALSLLQFGMFPWFPQMKSAFHKPMDLLLTALSVSMKLPFESVSDFAFKIKTSTPLTARTPLPSVQIAGG